MRQLIKARTPAAAGSDDLGDIPWRRDRLVQDRRVLRGREVVMVLLLKAKLPRAIAMAGGGSACFLLRMVAVARHWNLPQLLHHP